MGGGGVGSELTCGKGVPLNNSIGIERVRIKRDVGNGLDLRIELGEEIFRGVGLGLFSLRSCSSSCWSGYEMSRLTSSCSR